MFPRIKEIRLKRKMTQAEMAEKIGIWQTAYSHYETGARDITLETAIKIADILGVSLDYLAGRSDEP